MEAIMLRLGVGLFLVGLVAAAQAAQEDEVAPKLDLLTTQFVHSGAGFIPPYKFSASVVLARLPDNSPIESEPGGVPAAKPQQEFGWQQNYGSDLVPLPHLLRVEFKVEQLKISFRPNSVLVEGQGLNILIQPHSATMLWSKAFLIRQALRCCP
jgi:hypothetical protein